MKEEKHLISLDNRTVSSTVWTFDNIRAGHAVTTFKGLTSFSAGSPADVVRLHFGLRGDYNFSCRQLKRSFSLVGGHHNILYSDGFDMEVSNLTPEVETFGIQFPRELFIQFTQNATELLKRFSERIIAGKEAVLTENWGALNPSITHAIRQVKSCRYTGDLQRLFMLSKCLELLVLSAEACDSASSGRDVFLKAASDKEKIHAVRDLISERLGNPPSLMEIAKTVGLNEYKLKRGFKEVFGTTVYEYLTGERLNLAYQYLTDTDKTAAEIAFELGYSSPQHFSSAFRKKFGLPPQSVRKNP
jgi:AraC family transcriptional regulator, transcriptional activator of the genes for pyochelin and ferripyochelin receptors